MIKNIIFDMGNVLLRYNPQVSLDLFCKTKEEKDAIFKELFEGPEWVQGDLGRMTNEDKLKRVKKRLPTAMHSALTQCVYRWHICMRPISGALEFCKYAKKKGYALYVLSNASLEFYDYFERFAPFTFFDGIVVSADVHMIKPDIRIFHYLLNKYRLLPEECLFLDDMEKNVRGAKKAGLYAQLFTGDFETIKLRYNL